MSVQSCLLTDLPIEINNSEEEGVYSYNIVVNHRNICLKYSKRGEDWGLESGYLDNEDEIKKISEVIHDNIHILRSLILNGKWDIKQYKFLTKKIIFEQLKYYDYPKSTEDKLNYLFTYLFRLQKFDGQEINLDNLYSNDWKLLFLKNEKEFNFYLDSLSEFGYIYLDPDLFISNVQYLHTNFTLRGLIKSVENENSGKFSNNCFIAMSFDEEDLKKIYEESIFHVLRDKYNPILICYENFESDKTINDAMIAAIKKSKFMIADFTKQKRNVYFEVGYALGRGMQVIFSCRKDYFDDHNDINKMSAFDTNHFPHIIWKDSEDFKKQLKDRIEAYIE